MSEASKQDKHINQPTITHVSSRTNKPNNTNKRRVLTLLVAPDLLLPLDPLLLQLLLTAPHCHCPGS